MAHLLRLCIVYTVHIKLKILLCKKLYFIRIAFILRVHHFNEKIKHGEQHIFKEKHSHSKFLHFLCDRLGCGSFIHKVKGFTIDSYSIRLVIKCSKCHL